MTNDLGCKARAKLSAHVSCLPLTNASGCWQMIGTRGSATGGQHGDSATSYPNPSTGPTTTNRGAD